MTYQWNGARVAALAAWCSLVCLGGSTKTWIQSEYADFEKGHLQHLSMRSDGRLTLAPKTAEVFDASAAYLWALGIDSHGTLYTGGGPGAKLYSVSAGGAHKNVAEFDALEIHAIAIDKSDRVYVATSPDGKVYRVGLDGKAAEFYDPKQKYIWAMAFSPAGDLFIATGDRGEVHRVDRNGKGAVFFETKETHARSLAFDAKADLIIGTDPGGLVIRVTADGKGFVLYQMSKREVTAVAVAKDGAIYAAGVGSGSGGGIPPSMPGIPPGPADPALRVPLSPSPMPAAPPAQGAGTDVFRIAPDGLPEKVWTSAKDTVYAIAFDAQGRALVGAGNKGTLYRVDTPALYTLLVSMESSQITAMLNGPGGALYAATGNVGKVYRIGPGIATQGTIESDVFDAGRYSQWGRIKLDGEALGGKIAIAARTGNLDRADSNWSAWSAGEKPALTPARFVQWRATLTASGSGQSPDLDAVEVAYLPRNVAPRVEDVEVTPANYKFPAPVSLPFAVSTPATIGLPAIGKRAATSTVGSGLDLSGLSMQFAKGWLGARWNASDENGDTLSYTVEIRGSLEKEWKPLAEKLREKHMSFDSTAFPDGEYRLRVSASDAPSNVRDEAFTVTEVSAPFLIDNTPPAIASYRMLHVTPGLLVTWHAADALSVIERAEYSLDGGEWMVVEPVGRLSDALELDYRLMVTAPPGEHTVAVRVTDEYGNTGVLKGVMR